MSETERPIHVVIADDHPVTREGVRAALESAADIDVVGEAGDGVEAKKLVAELGPDILLLDLIMPGPRPADIERWVRHNHPETITLILTAHDRDYYLAETVKAGAVGFLTKEKAPQQLIAAIRQAAQGDVLLTPDQLARIQAWEEDVSARWQRLTKREREILGLMAEGKTTAEIAAALLITGNTVRTHVGNLLGKLEVDSREAALAWAWKHGFIEDETDAEGTE